MKIVPLRPKYLFNGSVNQQATSAQEKYGAELTIPRIHSFRSVFSSIPKLGRKKMFAPLMTVWSVLCKLISVGVVLQYYIVCMHVTYPFLELQLLRNT